VQVARASKIVEQGLSLSLALGALFFNIDDIGGNGNDTEAEKVG